MLHVFLTLQAILNNLRQLVLLSWIFCYDERRSWKKTHRAFTRKFFDSANDLLQNFDGSQSQEDHIQRLIIKYQEKLTILKELDDGILLLVADKHIEKEIEESEAFAAKYKRFY